MGGEEIVEGMEKGGGKEQEYKLRRRDYREMYDRKKKVENEEWMRRTTEARTEG